MHKELIRNSHWQRRVNVCNAWHVFQMSQTEKAGALSHLMKPPDPFGLYFVSIMHILLIVFPVTAKMKSDFDIYRLNVVGITVSRALMGLLVLLLWKLRSYNNSSIFRLTFCWFVFINILVMNQFIFHSLRCKSSQNESNSLVLNITVIENIF